MLGTAVTPELFLAGLSHAVTVADAGETVFDLVPEIILDDPQLRDVVDDPFTLGIDPCQALSRARTLYVALLVPDESADVELVV